MHISMQMRPRSGAGPWLVMHGHPVGKAPEEAVGIADGQHAHPGLSGGMERPAVADVRVRVKDLDGGDAWT